MRFLSLCILTLCLASSLMAFSEEVKKSVISQVMEDRASRLLDGSWLKKCECPCGKFARKKRHDESCYNKNCTDCAGTSYFMCHGILGDAKNIVTTKSHNITVIDGIYESILSHHQPYTVYQLLIEGRNGWQFMHFFTYLNNRYISRSGVGPIRSFTDFATMTKLDGFPAGLPTKGEIGKITKDITKAYMADKPVCTEEELQFTHEEFAKFKDHLNPDETKYFLSKVIN